MKQQTRRLVMMLTGALLCASSLVVVACSTDNGTTPLPGSSGGTDSGRDTGTTGKDGDPNADGDVPGDGGTGGDCSQAPVLHSNDKGGFYCAFLKARDGGIDAGGVFNCTNDETCCNPAQAGGQFPPSFCADTPAADKGATDIAAACADQAGTFGSTWTPNQGSTWECGDKASCNNGQVCCLYTSATAKGAGEKVNIGKYLDNTKVPASCNAEQAFKYGGTRCAATCAADELIVCSKSDNSCAGGKTCSPYEVVPGGRELAWCK